MEALRSDRLLGRADTPFLLLCLLTGIASLILVWQPPRFVFSHLLQDDCFYYLEIARNIAAGEGSTFDRIHATNGYHPLWCFLVVPVFLLVPHDTGLALHLVLTIQVLLMLACMALLYGLLRKRLNRPAALLPLLLWINPRFILFWLNGMPSILSTFLHLCLLTLALTRCPLDRPARAPRDDYLFGVLLGLAFLSRLDAVFLVLAVTLCVFGAVPLRREGNGWGVAFRRLVRMALPTALLALPYLAWNLVSFGHLVPISGTIKIAQYDLASLEFLRVAAQRFFWPLSFGGALLGNVLRDPLVAGILLAVLAALTTLGVLFLRTGGIAQLRRLSWLPGIAFYFLFCLLHYGYNSIFIPKSILYSWYWVPEVLAVLILAGCAFYVLFGWLEARRPLLARLWTGFAYALCVLLFLAVLAMRWDHPRHRFLAEIYNQAVWMRDNLPEDAIAAAWDAGAIGYFSERRVINLDGLVNSYAFQAVKRDRRYAAYLDAEGCRYVAQFFFDREDDMGKDLESIRHRLVERVYRVAVPLYDPFGYVPTVQDEQHTVYINVWRYGRSSGTASDTAAAGPAPKRGGSP